MDALPPFIASLLPFRSHFAPVRFGPRQYRMHYLDHGDGRPVLLLHGNPTWSFLWRKVMAALEGSGLRLVAPDLIGLGLSDKPHALAAHSLRNHGQALLDLVERLDLRDVVLGVQDWGGPMGAWMAARSGGRVTGLVVMNTSVLTPRAFKATAFHRFSHLPVVSDVAFRVFNFPVPVLGRTQGDARSISGDVARAYAWPLRHVVDRAAPLALARMVPNREGHPTVAELAEGDAWVRGFQGPAELVWGLRDPILGRALKRHREALPHARVTETQAGHFLQEEVPEEIAAAVRRVASAGA
ncbi:alpha/beta fold hydrolase [Myxococcus sp. RHSTA-1-4]|uniref:alpha/beta fold hydrolase n=1 Tax=Myxococcus sp. RHSTA-1-4 TaxID=2874601 RepID=UPI001CBE9D7F|nr:alpha/beta fold hydrolase [Myxococcus sp. RHSTA-1-4]